MNKLFSLLVILTMVFATVSCDDREGDVRPVSQEKAISQTASKCDECPASDEQMFHMLGVVRIEKNTSSSYVIITELENYVMEILTDNQNEYLVSFSDSIENRAYRFTYENSSIERGVMEGDTYSVTDTLVGYGDSVTYHTYDPTDPDDNLMMLQCISFVHQNSDGIDVPSDTDSITPPAGYVTWTGLSAQFEQVPEPDCIQIYGPIYGWNPWLGQMPRGWGWTCL